MHVETGHAIVRLHSSCERQGHHLKASMDGSAQQPQQDAICNLYDDTIQQMQITLY